MPRAHPILAALAALAFALPALAQPAPVQPTPPPPKAEPRTAVLTGGQLTVKVRDLSPRFLAFYWAAQDVPDPEARFQLWKALYGFAAVPPTPEGDAMARKLLDAAWPRYAEAVPAAEAGAAGMSPAPLPILLRVADILKLRAPGEIQLITYVGGFEDNAFSYRADIPVVAIPLEIPAAKRGLFLAHEGTHAVQMLVNPVGGGWERSVAATMIQEGLAMHVAREVIPGLPDEAYVAASPGWWAASRAKSKAILTDLRGKLTRSDSDTVMSVTIGRGASGLDREAYYGGWRVVRELRREGLSLAEIARIPEAEMPARVDHALGLLLAEG